MAAPTFSLTTTGSDPKTTTKSTLEQAVQAGFDALQDSIDTTALAGAIGTGTVYQSTAAGLADTSNGDTFMVAASNQLAAYLNDGGSATELATVPTQTQMDSALMALARRFEAVTDMAGDALLTYTSGSVYSVADGDIIEAVGRRFEVAPSGATDHDLVTLGGVKLYALDGFGAGTVSLSGKSVSSALTWRGAGKRRTILDGGGSTIMDLNAAVDDYVTLSDMRLKSTGATMITMTSASYFASFERVWFGDSDIAIDVDQAFYWSQFTDCVFRDNKTGFRNIPASGEDANAIAFTNCTFYHYDPTLPGVGHSVDVKFSDGITFAGCQVQNQGMRFDTCASISLIGGYWEAYDVPALTLVDTSISVQGTLFKSATKFNVDKASAEKWRGIRPNITATDSGGVEITDYHGQGMPEVGPYTNVFADPDCTTTAATDDLSYSPTGAHGAKSINGSSNVEIAFTASTQRSGMRLVGAGYISGFIKWRSTAGDNRLTLGGASHAYSRDHNSATDSDWQYSYFHAASNGSDPYFVFQTTGGSTGTVEVDTILLTDQDVAVTERYRQAAAAPLAAKALTVEDDADITGNATAALYKSVTGSAVTVAAAATETLYTFTDDGVYLVTVDQGTFIRTDQQYWTGVVVVGSNSALALTTHSSTSVTAGSSGLAFTITNNGGGSKDLTLKAVRVA